MSIIGGISLFMAGAAIGGGSDFLYHRGVKRAVDAVEARKNAEITKLRGAYRRLQEEYGIRQQASDCADAFRRGKSAAHRLSGAEQFAQTFEGRNVRFINTTKGGVGT